MLTDARNLDNETIIEGDLCIIGAGAAGISIAMEFLNTNQQVILLEGGGFQYEDRIQELFRGKTTGQPYYPLMSTRLHYFGGTTGHWGGMCSIFDPLVFRERAWVPHSGWPIDQEVLLPYYKRANSNVDLPGFGYDLPYWQQKDPELKTLPFDKEVFGHKIWRFSPPTRFGEKYRDPILKAPNIHLYTYANAVELLANEEVNSLTSVRVKNYKGKTHIVKAKYFVLACCAIQGARLLLASNKQAAAGLGNEHDLVGRFFMEHMELDLAELHVRKPDLFKLYFKSAWQMRAELAPTPGVQEAKQILNGIISFMPLSKEGELPPYIKSWTSNDPRENDRKIAELHSKVKENRLMRFFKSKKFRSLLAVMRLEQAPNPLSRVTLDTEKDELGVPRAQLNWAFTSFEKKTLLTLYEILAAQAGKNDIGRLRLKEELRNWSDTAMPASTSGGWHHMGTTRMSSDPRKGVVDANCKLHSMANLYVAGSACFPNGAAVNPTLTIIALSIRLADHLKAQLT